MAPKRSVSVNKRTAQTPAAPKRRELNASYENSLVASQHTLSNSQAWNASHALKANKRSAGNGPTACTTPERVKTQAPVMVVVSPKKDEKADPSSVKLRALGGAESGSDGVVASVEHLCDGLCAALVVRS
ncbi:uncharacterized protein PHALS_05541 [Plasmopara halstedii]|uniref:Uncharacterized protein n=1 Tax=Plasmopara halstedii TaxID=4781 RepID=A0A0P1B3U5_PLAHL|nr:uncharacterized protein PHALS_05541 [Plasmopara halstedii]CEG48065.1 hypothetical protein PHALS_05541 [Plasmopara halstedii]|eukprot:XP_024584434.1 hypothetical protein PHALS_05541 [Plasmopara halstedii]